MRLPATLRGALPRRAAHRADVPVRPSASAAEGARATRAGTEGGAAAPGRVRSVGALDAGLRSVTLTMIGLGAVMVASSFVVPDGHDAAPAAKYARLTPAQPVRLVVTSLGINAPVVPIGLTDDAALDPPSNYREVGWWDGSAEPGDRAGQTVVTGHTVHTGGGAMDDLPQLRHGFVDLVTGHGTMRYRVTKAIVASHRQVADYSHQLFGQAKHFDTGARLVLVTCTDYDGSEYRSNFIIVAQALGKPIPSVRAKTRRARSHHTDAVRSAAGS